MKTPFFGIKLVDSPGCFRSKDLQTETASLRERIKHLNDMVFCQQRKVKVMIEEVRIADLLTLGTGRNTDLLFYLCINLGGAEIQGRGLAECKDGTSLRFDMK